MTHVGIYEDNGVMIDASKRTETSVATAWTTTYRGERFMFARRIPDSDDTLEVPDPLPQPTSSPSGRRKAATRVLERSLTCFCGDRAARHGGYGAHGTRCVETETRSHGETQSKLPSVPP